MPHQTIGANGGLKFRFVTIRRLKQFHDAIEKSADTRIPVGPQEFFTKEELLDIASSPQDTHAVYLVYELFTEFLTFEEMLEYLFLMLTTHELMFIMSKEERLKFLTTC